MWVTDIAVKRPIAHNFGKGGLKGHTIQGAVLHIQQGTENGTWSWFNNPDAKASAHFGNPKTGKLEQFVDTDDKAWAQKAGNDNWLSVENEGQPGDALTASQMENIARLMVWMNQTLGVPIQLANGASDSGLGYHSMGGTAWGHPQCPGAPIIQQRAAIIAAAQQILSGNAGAAATTP